MALLCKVCCLRCAEVFPALRVRRVSVMYWYSSLLRCPRFSTRQRFYLWFVVFMQTSNNCFCTNTFAVNVLQCCDVFHFLTPNCVPCFGQGLCLCQFL